MRAEVDPDLCGACGVCVEMCPEVFEMKEDIAVVIADPVPKDAEETCRDAEEECPAGAIVLT